MPCPLTGSEDDAVNQELGVFPAKGYCVDGSQNDEAQQAAGKKLVEYLTIERAQDMSDALSIALPFKNVDVTVASPLANATQAYVADGKVQSTYAFSALLPSDFWSENGAVMQQYLVGRWTEIQLLTLSRLTGRHRTKYGAAKQCSTSGCINV